MASNGNGPPRRDPLYVAQLPLSRQGKPQIQRVLIANRGEIACRVIQTCQKLGIVSVAIYVEEDSWSRHVTDADEAISLGSVSQADTNPFLNIKLLVDTAIKAKADALHPGYGYLSENAKFADAVREAGIIFLGPSSKAMSTLGDKRTSKEYLQGKVPLVPGFAGSSQDAGDLEAAAEEIGFPVMLKASAGGGGRGMRIVREKSTLRDELSRAQSEAARSFGSNDCILEKYIEAGKHIEFQIVGDSHGNVLSLWDRECSVQRRHQKVIEEAPSPWLNPKMRKEMSDVAVRIGKLLGYESAGTVEFVVDAKTGDFYFLEVNARLQVEHPITEEVTGFDIISLQLFVAAGGDLSTLNRVSLQGHAIECRLCAEEPLRDFFPEHGTIRLWRPAPVSAEDERNVRFETAVKNGSVVSIYFDSMIAKIVVWAPDRTMAIEKMTRILANTVCAGVRTNQLFLQSCLQHDAFVDPGYTTSFINSNLKKLLQNPHTTRAGELARTLSIIPSVFLRNISTFVKGPLEKRPFQNSRRAFRNQTFDPVGVSSNIVTISDPLGELETLLCVHQDEGKVLVAPLPPVEAETESDDKSTAREVTARYNAISNAIRGQKWDKAAAYTVAVEQCDAQTTRALGEPWVTANMDLTINGGRVRAHLATENMEQSVVTQTGRGQRVFCHLPALGTWIDYRCYNLLSYCESVREVATIAAASTTEEITAPMPCKVLTLLKKVGEEVKSGESVMVIESMKMEMSMTVFKDGKFQTKLKEGDAVDEGTVLCWVE